MKEEEEEEEEEEQQQQQEIRHKKQETKIPSRMSVFTFLSWASSRIITLYFLRSRSLQSIS
jgi:hypothetical protein